jgi:hypothetical protein
MSKFAYETHPHFYTTVQTGKTAEIVYIGERGHKKSLKALVAFSAKTGFPISTEQQKFIEQYGIRTPKVKKAVKAKRTRATKTGTKAEKALAMFRENVAVSKEDFIKRLIAELDMTTLGAQTYYYNCKKAV